MQPIPGQVQERVPARRGVETRIPTANAPTTKEIPYDYVARFKLRGEAGNRVEDVINVSVEGTFVAVAIGYSFIPAPLLLALNRQGDPTQPVAVGVAQAAVSVGPAFANPREVVRMLVQGLLVKLCGIDFKYTIIDSASGRELQNLPIHNIAGLGESTGNRPFRPLAKPVLFMPRSTIRIQVEEVSVGPIYGYEDPVTRQRIGAELFIVLHGYKMLGYGTG